MANTQVPSSAEMQLPDDCLLRECVFTEEGTCTAHGEWCPDCPCGTLLHWEPR